MDFQKSMDHKLEDSFKNPDNLGPWIGNINQNIHKMCIFVAKKHFRQKDTALW
jgi:pantothenate kinase